MVLLLIPARLLIVGYDESQLCEVLGLLAEIADMNAFCAWIREAIKAKEAELNDATMKSYEEWLKENNLENKRPDYEEVTTDDVKAEMTVKERNEYFHLEAVAATYSHTPSIDQQKVDDLFFELQKWHRSNEQQLNRIKYNIRRKVAKQNLEKSQQYRSKMEEYNIRFRELDAKFKEWKIKECERISQLKIVIPLELQPIYDVLCALEQ